MYMYLAQQLDLTSSDAVLRSNRPLRRLRDLYLAWQERDRLRKMAQELQFLDPRVLRDIGGSSDESPALVPLHSLNPHVLSITLRLGANDR